VAVFVVGQGQGGGGDVAGAPGAAAVAARRREGGLGQGAGAFAEAAQRAVNGVVGLLVDGQSGVGWFLGRGRERGGLVFVARVGRGELAVGDPLVDAGDLPRIFRTASLRLVHAASCLFRYSLWTSSGVL